eukprot:CAMPEP_0113325444 /NCGR_PEP_ID=MMETSP0010_2-20120614/17764_1 /TAXON_ID=216773 ORGANISM="Corethron hystrix, Strain 308" /NCGR_SAMPLE_ID=MMETSP0010_2 /ASSEMBLY_ACC=CAM_ASM_000155 /LENGTH=82 /DNA_ID=CAMNT_0000185255 /DNA_START=222 /DNA_END=466 /DNA_ORIENTATION=- /assembly_acc=CAM_ASM_000155
MNTGGTSNVRDMVAGYEKRRSSDSASSASSAECPSSQIKKSKIAPAVDVRLLNVQAQLRNVSDVSDVTETSSIPASVPCDDT